MVVRRVVGRVFVDGEWRRRRRIRDGNAARACPSPNCQQTQHHKSISVSIFYTRLLDHLLLPSSARQRFEINLYQICFSNLPSSIGVSSSPVKPNHHRKLRATETALLKLGYASLPLMIQPRWKFQTP